MLRGVVWEAVTDSIRIPPHRTRADPGVWKRKKKQSSCIWGETKKRIAAVQFIPTGVFQTIFAEMLFGCVS